MRTVRVYAGQPLTEGVTVKLSDDAARHVIKVLRMRAGDALVLFDGSGCDFAATLTDTNRHSASVLVGSAVATASESPLRISLWHGICRSSRMDYVVQKATELGVDEIQPLIVERSVVRLDEDRAARKAEHWQSIAVSAAEQSGRSVVPSIAGPAKLDACLADKSPDTRGIILHPGEHPGVAAQAMDAAHLILITGPEGGFSEAEFTAAVAAGFAPASLGPRILRSETAPVAALSILQYAGGDLG